MNKRKSVLKAHLLIRHQISNDDSGRPRHPRKAMHEHLPALSDSCMNELPCFSEMCAQADTRVVQHFDYLVVVFAGELGGQAVAESEDMRDFAKLEGGAGVGCAY